VLDDGAAARAADMGARVAHGPGVAALCRGHDLIGELGRRRRGTALNTLSRHSPVICVVKVRAVAARTSAGAVLSKSRRCRMAAKSALSLIVAVSPANSASHPRRPAMVKGQPGPQTLSRTGILSATDKWCRRTDIVVSFPLTIPCRSTMPACRRALTVTCSQRMQFVLLSPAGSRISRNRYGSRSLPSQATEICASAAMLRRASVNNTHLSLSANVKGNSPAVTLDARRGTDPRCRGEGGRGRRRRDRFPSPTS
jgi:hypothetical protein